MWRLPRVFVLGSLPTYKGEVKHKSTSENIGSLLQAMLRCSLNQLRGSI